MDEILINLSSSNLLFHSLNDVQEHISTNDLVSFATDVTVTEPVVISKKCTIDLGGHFMFITIPSAITVKGGVEVSFVNGKIQTLSSEQIEDAIIVQGSKTVVNFDNTLEMSTRGTAIHVRRRGCAVIDGALISSTGSQSTIYVDDEKSVLKVKSGSIESYEKSAIVARASSSLEIDGGEIHTESNGLIPETSYPSIVVSGRYTSLVITDGLVFSDKTAAISVDSSAKLEIYGGEIYSHSSDYIPVEIRDPNTSFKMYDGFLHSSKTSAILSVGLEFGESHIIQMLGGKMGGVGQLIETAGPGDHDILLSKGTVKGDVPQKYIATGYVVSDIKDDEGYAEIILKTWTDKSTTSSVVSTTNDDKENPFDLDENPFDFSQSAMNFNNVPDDFEEHPFEPGYVPMVPPVPPTYSSIPRPPKPRPPKPQPIIYNSSVNINNTVYIYNTPSRKQKITEWKGALRILNGGFFSPSGEEFAMVKFRVPGSGSTATGYVPVCDISHP